MKKILSIVLVLALLGGGGAGAYFYFMKPAEASQPEDGKPDVKKAEKEKKETDKSKHAFVELDALILPIIDETGVTQTVSLVVAIEVADEKTAALVETQKPRLKDAYIQKMYGILNNRAALKGGVIQVDQIKQQLNEISDKVLGEDVVEDVLLQVVQQRPV